MVICNWITGMISSKSFWYIGMVHFVPVPQFMFTSVSLSFLSQRSVYSLKEDELQVCVQTPTADSSPSPLTISMRCSKSTPWCGVLSKPLPLTDWTVSVSPVLDLHMPLVLSDWSTLLPVIVPSCLVFISICLPFTSLKHCVCHLVLHDLYAIFYFKLLVSLSQITLKKIGCNQH